MNDPKPTTLLLSAVLLLFAAASARVQAVQVQDLVRIKGAESSKLVGMGLVIGLNGTGDGGKSLPTMRRLASMMSRLGDPTINPLELKDAKNVAVVYITAKLPASGVREGDEIDLQVAAPGASSLAGGRLVITPMLGPLPNSPVFAYAEGPILLEDPVNRAVGTVKRGATLTRDVLAQHVDDGGRMTLVLSEANATWPMASTLATLINDLMAPDGPPIAQAIDQKNVVVQIPLNDRRNPGPFITQILEVQIDPTLVRTEARVVINQKTGTIVMTENVQISPVVITHEGLTITTLQPPRPPTPEQPITEQNNFLALDPGKRSDARLADLVNAFNQLKVPPKDRIAILKEIHRSGKLHAQLILED
jgi:flagellar P-ring protein precursor FlgI